MTNEDSSITRGIHHRDNVIGAGIKLPEPHHPLTNIPHPVQELVHGMERSRGKGRLLVCVDKG